MKDGRTVLVNLNNKDILLGNPDLFYKFGMWTEVDGADESVTEKITEILKEKL